MSPKVSPNNSVLYQLALRCVGTHKWEVKLISSWNRMPIKRLIQMCEFGALTYITRIQQKQNNDFNLERRKPKVFRVRTTNVEG